MIYRFLLMLLLWGGSIAAQAQMPYVYRANRDNMTGYTRIDSVMKLYRKVTSKYVISYLGDKQFPYIAVLFVETSPRNIDYWLIGSASKADEFQQDFQKEPTKVYLKGTLANHAIFQYPFIKYTSIIKSKCGLNFVPPVICEQHIIAYQDAHTKLYFEIDEQPDTYVPSPKRQRYRDEWFGIINPEVEKILEQARTQAKEP